MYGVTRAEAKALGFRVIVVSNRQPYRHEWKDGEVRVHDCPITAVVKGLDKDGADVALTFERNYDKEEKTLHTNYFGIDSDAVKLVLTVGYASAASIPAGLVDGIYMVLEHMFNQKETGNSTLPMAATQLLNTYRRFLL